MLDILWILAQVISPIFGLIYGLALSRWRYSKRKTLIIAFILIAALTIANFLAIRYYYPIVDLFPAFDFTYRVCNVILVVAIAMLLVRGRTAETPRTVRMARVTFCVLSVCACIFVVDTVAITIRTLFGMFPLELLCELLLYPLMLPVVIWIRKPFVEVSHYMGNRQWPLCFVPLSLVVAILMLISIPTPLEQNPGNIPIALVMCVVAVTTYGTLFYLFKTVRAQGNLEQDAAAFRLYTSSLEHQIELVNRNAHKALIFRHDLRHIAQLMQSCLENGDRDGMRELIGNLDRNVSDRENRLAVSPITGDHMIDATFSYYADLSYEAGIDFTVNIDPPVAVKADKTELAVVVANALENAVHACEKVPDGEKRAIRVDGRKQGKQYFLEIANTCAGEIIFDPNTGLPVSGMANHGVGSQSIAFFARKYSAELEYTQIKNWFHLRLLL